MKRVILCNGCTKQLLILFGMSFLCLCNAWAKENYFVNPVTDICWDCVFPMSVSGVNVTPGHKDQVNYSKTVCFCSGTPPKAGIPISFWEPKYLIDVTRHAYKLIGLGGVRIGKESFKNRGSIGIIGEGASQNSFYHVHLYKFPILALLSALTDFKCIEKGKLDCVFLSELDPLWNDEGWAAVLNPEAILFSSSLAQVACIADCVGSSFDKPLDKLFWCGGCQGSLYPFTGAVAHHIGGLQASSLLVHRVLAKLHRSFLLKGFKEDNFCEAEFLPIIKKSNYKTQLLHPKTQKKGPCHSLGKTDLIWGIGKSYPCKGEDFVYLIWTKNQCCLDAVKPAAKSLIGGS
ncbi:MAG: hypothetical protein K1000chlam3_00469 [Chlamydiae bacterium]|nr:hypothetical protein [Chlamydiota bacterium]